MPYLFKSKDVLIKVELNLFIGDVYAQLLKRVPLKVLEAKDVQNTHIHPALCSTSNTETRRNFHIKPMSHTCSTYLIHKHSNFIDSTRT